MTNALICDAIRATLDEHPRKTSLEALGDLTLGVRTGGTVTAGSASGMNDGACALLLARQTTAEPGTARSAPPRTGGRHGDGRCRAAHHEH